MKLIGITGKSGAGKTTLSNLIGQNENVGVIHIDELMEKVKKQKLSGMMDNNKEGEPVAIKKNIRKILYGNKYIFLAYIKAKGILLNPKINEKIKQLEEEGKEVVVIECIYLKYFPIFKQLDKKVLVQRPYIKRQESVLERDKEKNMDKEVFAIWDLPHKRSYYKDDIGSYEYKINNNNDKDYLKQVAKEIYEDVKEISIQDKRKQNFKPYKCKTKKLEIDRNSPKIREEEKTNETR